MLTDQIAVRRLIGYCPQHNALMPRLTCREHLELFARIKGVPTSQLRDTCTRLIAQMVC